MPRLPNVTMHELEDLIDAAHVVVGQMHDCADRILKGYCATPEKLQAKIMALNGVISGASALLGSLVQKSCLEELKVETEKTLTERAAVLSKGQGPS